MARDSGITPRTKDYSQWYLDVISNAELADNSPVKGCMVLRPNGFALWEGIQSDLDRRFKETGHRNAYFPLFIPLSFLSKEAEHVEGFAKECAVVTHHRLRSTMVDGKPAVQPDPDSQLEEPLIVRPTSETIIWHMYKNWIDSHRDLPLLYNQWANVVRWELRTRPFLRTAEFLWQEGHTAHASKEEAVAEAEQMLQVYVDFCRETLAIPVIPGVKTASERFAGAVDTYTIEAMMQNGWALQAGTSHFLGQNFAKAFDVTFQDVDGERKHVWATSWGVSTRLIGALIMAHSDDTGLIAPPAIAPTQVVIVPIARKEHERAEVLAYAEGVRKTLAPHFRVELDDRDKMKPGAKYFEWERKGTPLRLEIGPRDMEKGSVFAAPRFGEGGKFGIPLDTLVETVTNTLESMQAALLERAETMRNEALYTCTDYEEFKTRLKEDGGFYLVPWCDDAEAEAVIKTETKATIRCYPLVLPEAQAAETADWVGKLPCFKTGRPSTHVALFARAY